MSSSSSSSSPSSSKPLNDDEFIWTSHPLQSTPLTQQLTSYEQSTLHCPICHQFFVNAATLRPCNHVFCGLCIRKALKEGNKIRRVHSCPICKVETRGAKEDNYLVPNWGLQTAVEKYKEMRRLLYQNILDSQQQQKQQQKQQQEKVQVPSTFNDGSCNGDESMSSTSASVSMRTRQSVRQDSQNHTDGSQCGNENENKNKSDNLCYPNANAVATAASVPAISTAATTAIISTGRTMTMKRMPSYHLHNTKKTQLKRWCQDNGLSTHGTDEDKKWRLRNFVDLYNAECDAMNPRSRSVLVRELERREKDEKLAKKRLTDKVYLERLKESRKELGNQSKGGSTSSTSGANLLTSGSAAFDKKLQNGFSDLIAKYRQKQDGQKGKGIKRKVSDLADEINNNRSSSISNSRNTQPVVQSLAQDLEQDSEVKIISTAKSPSSLSPILQRGTPFRPNVSSSASSSIKKESRTDVADFWACSRCTFHNETRQKFKCKMCGEYRSKSDEKQKATTAVC